jgi:hypothetical protein
MLGRGQFAMRHDWDELLKGLEEPNHAPVIAGDDFDQSGKEEAYSLSQNDLSSMCITEFTIVSEWFMLASTSKTVQLIRRALEKSGQIQRSASRDKSAHYSGHREDDLGRLW